MSILSAEPSSDASANRSGLSHTAGPWFASADSVYRNQYQNGQIADCDVGSAPLSERVANARLIAAAPDLLFELEGIVHFADGFAAYHDGGPLGDELRKWINGARAAIAKAEGRS